MTTAICYDIWQVRWWGFGDGVGETETTIKLLAGLIFVLLSIATNRTTSLYYKFYENVGLMFGIPWYLLFCDFISNIVVNITITLFSYLFLCESEDYTDLVLNAFALQFVAEIDDMLNTFDSDEDVVLNADLRAFWKGDCVVPRQITYQWRDFVGVLWAPFGILQSIITGCKSLLSVFINKKHKSVLLFRQKRLKRKDT